MQNPDKNLFSSLRHVTYSHPYLRYVENGGTLLMSFFNGIVDENEHIHMGGYPAPFRDMLGIFVEEYALYTETQTNAIRPKDGKQFQCTFWSDVIHLKGADSIADFEEDYYAGYPAITRNTFGKGRAYYVGTVLEQSRCAISRSNCASRGRNSAAHERKNKILICVESFE